MRGKMLTEGEVRKARRFFGAKDISSDKRRARRRARRLDRAARMGNHEQLTPGLNSREMD